MDKESSTAIWIVLLIIIPIISSSSMPQFLLFEGHVKIDGRTAPQGTLINFSIQGIELANSVVSSTGQYGPIFIQGFPKFYDEQINIRINEDESEQKIYYVSPQNPFLNLSALTEKALKISDSSPVNSRIEIQKTGMLVFDISTLNGYEDEVNHSWFLDREIKFDLNDVSFSSFSYTINNMDSGEHNISVFASDGFLSIFKEWALIIIRPQAENFDGETTDFSDLGLDDLDNIRNVIFEKTGKGKIEFLEDLNLSGVADLNNKIKIENGIVAIDSSFYPQLNKKAKITLTGLHYATLPKIFYTSGFTTNANSINNECEFCTILNYTSAPTDSGTVVFEVEHFSSFKVAGGGEKYNMELFSNLDKCENGTQGELTIDIRNPDDGDDFKPEEEMEIEVKVTNEGDENKKIIVEAILYNFDTNREEESVKSDDEKVKSGKSETFDLSLDVPEDFDEKDDYILFVKAYEKNKEENQCSYEIINIDLDREKHDVIIENVLVDSFDIYPGENVELNVEVKNIGTKDEEDVYIYVSNKNLGISEKSETFDIDEGDSFFKMFNIKIPDNSTGEYVFDVKVVFDDEEYSKSEVFSVLPDSKDTLKSGTGKTIMLRGKMSQKNFFQSVIDNFNFEKYWLLYFIGLLIIGILILIVLIIRILFNN